MDNECDRDPSCGVLLRNNEVDDGRAKPVNQSAHGSTLVIFSRL